MTINQNRNEREIEKKGKKVKYKVKQEQKGRTWICQAILDIMEIRHRSRKDNLNSKLTYYYENREKRKGG